MPVARAGRLGVVMMATLALILSLLQSLAPAPAGAATSERIAGADRLGTSALAAERAFASGADTAILARADDYPDALAAAGLAGTLEAPVILTSSRSLAGVTRDALQSLGVSRVVLLGGTGAVSAEVARQLEGLGLDVERISGRDRYTTAAAIARRMGEVGTVGGKRTAFLASGDNFPDALSAGPPAFAERLPLLLTRPGGLPGETITALEQLDIERVIVLGGKAAVGERVESELKGLGVAAQRIAGRARDETASKLATFATQSLGFSATEVILVRQDSFPDALSAGPLGGRAKAPILLSGRANLAAASGAWLLDRCSAAPSVLILGGGSVVSDGVAGQARDVLAACQLAEDRNVIIAGAGLSDPSKVPAQSAGTLRVTKDGAVVENGHWSFISIEADDVTLRNVRLTGHSRYGIRNTAGHRNLTVEDSELVCTSNPDETSACLISWGSHTVRNSRIEAYGADAVKTAGDMTYEGNHIVAAKPGGSDHHTDGIQTRGGDNLRVVGNVIEVPASQGGNSAMIIQAAERDIRGVEIRNNWLAGGNYTVYTTEKGRAITNVRITGNVFAPSKDRHPLGYRFGIHRGRVDDWSGNVWSHTGKPAGGR